MPSYPIAITLRGVNRRQCDIKEVQRVEIKDRSSDRKTPQVTEVRKA